MKIKDLLRVILCAVAVYRRRGWCCPGGAVLSAVAAGPPVVGIFVLSCVCQICVLYVRAVPLPKNEGSGAISSLFFHATPISVIWDETLGSPFTLFWIYIDRMLVQILLVCVGWRLILRGLVSACCKCCMCYPVSRGLFGGTVFFNVYVFLDVFGADASWECERHVQFVRSHCPWVLWIYLLADAFFFRVGKSHIWLCLRYTYFHVDD